MRCKARLQAIKGGPARRLRPEPSKMDCRAPDRGSQCNPSRPSGVARRMLGPGYNHQMDHVPTVRPARLPDEVPALRCLFE